METINMLFSGDFYQLNYDDIKTIFKNHSRVARKRRRYGQGQGNSSPCASTNKHEIGNML